MNEIFRLPRNSRKQCTDGEVKSSSAQGTRPETVCLVTVWTFCMVLHVFQNRRYVSDTFLNCFTVFVTLLYCSGFTRITVKLYKNCTWHCWTSTASPTCHVPNPIMGNLTPPVSSTLGTAIPVEGKAVSVWHVKTFSQSLPQLVALCSVLWSLTFVSLTTFTR